MNKVAVVGGGLVGACAAYHLIRHGTRVTWIDATRPGQATSAGAGILPPDDHFAPKAALGPLLRAARNYYPQLCELLAQDGVSNDFYKIVGCAQVARNETEAAAIPSLVRTLEQRRQAGFGHIGQVVALNGSDARRLIPDLGEDTVAACYAPGAARVQGRLLLEALRKALRRRGVRILNGTAVPQIASDRIDSLSVGSEVVRPDQVLLAAGSWSGDFARALGITTTVSPQRGQLLQLRLPSCTTPSCAPTVLSFDFNYAVWLPEGQLLAGATRDPVNGYDASPTASGVLQLLNQTLLLLPGLANCQFEQVRVGLRPITQDGLPLLGALDGLRDTFIATGHGSYGLETGPLSGALVAQQILGEQPSICLDAFSNRRFSVTPTVAHAPTAP